MKLIIPKQIPVYAALLLVAVSAAMIPAGKEPVGVGAKVPKGAEVLFDGSRRMLDEKWIYWQGPRLAATMPIKWAI